MNFIDTCRNFLLERAMPLVSDTMNKRSIFVFDTKHSVERKDQREISDEDIEFTLKQGIEWLGNHEAEYKDQTRPPPPSYSIQNRIKLD